MPFASRFAADYEGGDLFRSRFPFFTKWLNPFPSVASKAFTDAAP